MIQLVILPSNGWSDIAKANLPAKELLSDGLYPLFGITALTSFMSLAYDSEMSLVTAIQSAVITFISFFATYFVANMLFSTFIGKVMQAGVAGDSESRSVRVPDERLYSTFIIYNLAVLSVITLIQNLLPFELALLQILPFCIVFVMWKGDAYLGIPEKKIGHFMFLSVFSILTPTYLLQYLFKLMIG